MREARRKVVVLRGRKLMYDRRALTMMIPTSRRKSSTRMAKLPLNSAKVNATAPKTAKDVSCCNSHKQTLIVGTREQERCHFHQDDQSTYISNKGGQSPQNI